MKYFIEKRLEYLILSGDTEKSFELKNEVILSIIEQIFIHQDNNRPEFDEPYNYLIIELNNKDVEYIIYKTLSQRLEPNEYGFETTIAKSFSPILKAILTSYLQAVINRNKNTKDF